MSTLSIIIPVHNDLENGYLKQQISLFKKFPTLEVLYVDGGSTDGSVEFIQASGFEPIISEKSNRAERINLGIEKSSGETILINHPRSILNKEGISFLLNSPPTGWGAFTHRFDKEHFLLDFTSWYSNEVRLRVREIAYLDHCIFFNKALYRDKQLLPNIEIFEDTALSNNLGLLAGPTLLPYPSITSSIRFYKNGVFYQSLLNQFMKICWYLRLSPELMNKIYEKGLELNSRV